MPADRPDRSALLCGLCGYPLDGVLREPACPECGRPIARSLPGFRTGSPWQQRPGLRRWLATGTSLLHWRHLFDRIRIEPTLGLRNINLAAAAGLLTAGYLAWEIDQALTQPGRGWAGVLGTALLVLPIAAALLWTLTAIEAAGLRFFGNRRGGRITRTTARAVVAHASYGWVLAGALACGGAWLGQTVLLRPLTRETAGWLIGVPRPHALLGAAGFMLGLVVFETISYLGVIRCRFANPERANPEPTLPDDV